MDKKTEALKLAMETLEKIHAHPKSFWNCMDEITAIREALAEQSVQQQEPLAWLYNGKLHEIDPSDWATGTVTPLFPLAQRKPLTDADIERIYEDHHDKFGQPVDSKENGWAYERAIISAALGVKEKNNG